MDEAWEDVPPEEAVTTENEIATPETEAVIETDKQPAIPLQPISRPAGHPSVRQRVARPTIGAVNKVNAPTFGRVRGTYN